MSGRKKMSRIRMCGWKKGRTNFCKLFNYIAENLDSSVQLTHELSTQIWKEKVVGRTHKGKVYGLGSENDVRRIQSGLECIGSSLLTPNFDPPRYRLVFELLSF
ncbi:hypothetical protein MTR67_012164 [Solanum verrucosum]|uniref:Uncharacterized protein n=1 Tax=Solanum verrucosum TaxID=315347 RepID=A0AAF0Q843_SOLVR|nr:hypothetical protein MTR67_012164 [Solanum verrucosum]